MTICIVLAKLYCFTEKICVDNFWKDWLHTLNIYSYFATEWCMRREQQVRYVEVGEHLRLTGIYSFQKMSTQIFSVKQ